MKTRSSSSSSPFKKVGLPAVHVEEPAFAKPLPKTPKRYKFTRIAAGDDGEGTVEETKTDRQALKEQQVERAPVVSEKRQSSTPYNIVIKPPTVIEPTEPVPGTTVNNDNNDTPRQSPQSPFVKVTVSPSNATLFQAPVVLPVPGAEPLVKKARIAVYKYDMSYLEERAESYLTEALVPFKHFGGMLANTLGDRKMWSYWKYPANYNGRSDTPPIPLAMGAKTVPEFLQQNAHLGPDFFALILPLALRRNPESKKKNASMNALIGAGSSALARRAEDEQFITNMISRNVPMLNAPVAAGAISPIVLFSSLPFALFDDLFHATSIGAMLRAQGQINRVRASSRPFTLKELVLSPEVADVFALYVAYQYLMASGGNAYAGRVTAGGGTTFMISAGIKTREKLYSDIATGQFWWQDVFVRANPIKDDLRKEIVKQRRLLEQKASLNNVSKESIRQLVATNRIDRDLLVLILTAPYDNLPAIVNAKFQADLTPFDNDIYNQGLFALRLQFVLATRVNPSLENQEDPIEYMQWGNYKSANGVDPPTDGDFLQALSENERDIWNKSFRYSEFYDAVEQGEATQVSEDQLENLITGFTPLLQNLETAQAPAIGAGDLLEEGQILSEELSSSDFEKLRAYARVFLKANDIPSLLVQTEIERIAKLEKQLDIVMDSILVHRE